MRSRIIGSKAAVGKVLIFLDSHVEVLEGWFPTIVARVMEDRKTVSFRIKIFFTWYSLILFSLSF